MKTKIAFLAVFITFGIIRMFGQSVPEENSEWTNITAASPPTYETTTNGLDIKVWVMTAEEHRQMMESKHQSNMGDDNMSMNNNNISKDKDMKKTSMSGTHHMKVEVTDMDGGQTRIDLLAKVEIKSPTDKTSWVDLRNMSDHYGSDLNLKEKGDYQFTIRIDDKGITKTTEFKYTVQ